MGRKSLRAKAAERMKNSRGLTGAHGHFTRAAAATIDASDCSDEHSSPHQEEQDHDDYAKLHRVISHNMMPMTMNCIPTEQIQIRLWEKMVCVLNFPGI
jgi:hypothetical protein